MRFNKNKFTFLDNLLKNLPIDIIPGIKDKFNGQEFKEEKDFLFNKMVPLCSKEIYYLANSIKSKLEEPKLITKLLKLKNEIPTQCGTLLFSDNVNIGKSGFTTVHNKGFGYFYSFFNCIGDPDKSDIVIFKTAVFVDNMLIQYICGHWKKESPELLYLNSTNYLSLLTLDPSNVDPHIRRSVDSLTALLLFLKFAEIETKLLTNTGANKKLTLNKEKYLNELDAHINIIDSTWFTTLVKSSDFNVNGHFRLQPCGKGNNERKLIWINDFVKHGYSRKAKILTI